MREIDAQGPPSCERRGFLLAGLALASGTVAAASPPSSAGARAGGPGELAADADAARSYRETAHVRAYYESARG